MKSKHIQTGKDGEDIAAKYLEENGFVILLRNVKRGRVEVDILAQENNELVFVEVKTREHNYFGYPEASVHKKKMENLAKVANIICEEMGYSDEIRFDIISITLSSPIEIYHIRDAFFPGLK